MLPPVTLPLPALSESLTMVPLLNEAVTSCWVSGTGVKPVLFSTEVSSSSSWSKSLYNRLLVLGAWRRGE